MRQYDDVNYDTQPEKDMPGSRLLSLSMGLFLGCGLILGALLGAMFGHFWLNDAFGFGGDILVGAIAGAIIVAILAVVAVKTLSSRMANRHEGRASRAD